MRPRLQALLLALAAVPLVGACDDDDCFECGGWQDVYEVEPNDQPFQANWLGSLYPGEDIAVHGRITQYGPDLLDGFAMRSGGPIHVQFALWADAPGADLDVCLYDPDLGDYIACWETPAHPETGAFSIFGAGKDVHLVVSSWLGDSAYTLELRVYDACCGDEAPPGGVFADGLAAPHRAGSEQRWARYALGDHVLSAERPRLVLPAEVVEVDLASGAVLRRPAVVEPLGSR